MGSVFGVPSHRASRVIGCCQLLGGNTGPGHGEVARHRKLLMWGLAQKGDKMTQFGFYDVRPFLGHFDGKFIEIISSKAPGNYSASIWSNICSICLSSFL